MRWLLVRLTEAIMRLMAATLRLEIDDGAGILGQPQFPPVIIIFWHNRLGLMPYFCERFILGRSTYAMISASRDGQFISEVVARFGIKALRGSSSRKGAAAALGAVRVVRDSNASLAITPDGPRGPRYVLGAGLLRLAQATALPIVAITFELSWKRELASWDRFQIPLPFSRCRLVTRGPISVPNPASKEELARVSDQILGALFPV